MFDITEKEVTGVSGPSMVGWRLTLVVVANPVPVRVTVVPPIAKAILGFRLVILGGAR